MGSHLARIYPFVYLKVGKRSSAWLAPIYVLDLLMRPLLGFASTVAMGDPKIIAIGCPGHLGDMLIMTGLLAQLRSTRNSRIILVGSGSNLRIAELFIDAGMADRFIEYTHTRLNRSSDSLWQKLILHAKTFWTARRQLKEEGCDCFIDLRPYWPHAHLLGRLCGAKWNIGFGLRGLGYTLTNRILYTPGLSLGDQYLQVATFFGYTPEHYTGPTLPDLFFSKCAKAEKPHMPEGPFWIVHPFSGERVRQSEDRLWIRLLATLMEERKAIRLVIVGSRTDESSLAEMLVLTYPGRVFNYIGKTPLENLFLLCRAAEGGLTVDSFVSHALLAAKKCVIVLDNLGVGTRMSFPADGVKFLPIRGRHQEETAQQLKLLLQTEQTIP